MSTKKKTEKKTADVAIVMPVYNRARLVKRTIRSIEAQKVWPSEFIIVDNNSTDNSLQVVTELADELRAKGMNVKVLTENVQGAAASRNRGLAEVTAKWVMFFDSDDEMKPLHIKEAFRTADQHPDADLVGWDCEAIALDGNVEIRPFSVFHAKRRNLYHGNMATQRYMARTELIRKAGGWDEKILIWNDIELGARILSFRPKMVKRTGELHVLIHAQRESITGSTFAERVDKYGAPLRAIINDLTPRWLYGVALKAMILAADMTLEGSNHGPEWRDKILAAVPGAWPRAVLRAAYAYRCRGLRGGARLFHYLLPKYKG